MRILHISVLDKKATYQNRDGDIVCGNSDYVIEFAFDAEWAAHEEKIARFIWNEHYTDVEFTGTTCAVPIITNTTVVEVGVYAGELSTTTPAIIGCQKSILCRSSVPGGTPFTKGEKGDPGAKSWNDLEDKPFYDESYTGEITIEYDGDPTGKTTVITPEGNLVKVTDWISEPSELIGGTGTMGGQTIVISEDIIEDARSQGLPVVIVGSAMFIAYAPFSYMGLNFVETGVYVFDMGVPMSLTYTGTATRIHTLNPKYIPGGIGSCTGGNSGSIDNLHVLDIGSEELDVTALDLSGYANGDVLLIVQNMSQ